MKTRPNLWALIGLSFLILALGEAAARAEDDEAQRVLVLGFKGKKTAKVREKVVTALSSAGVEIISPAKAKKAAQKMGLKAVPASPEKRLEIAEKLEADAYVAGRLSVKKGGVRVLSLSVFPTCEKGEGHDRDFEWKGPMPDDTLAAMVDHIRGTTADAVQQCAAPPEPAEVEEEPVEEEETPVPAAEEKEKGKKKKKKKKAREKAAREPMKHCKLGGPRCGYPPALAIDAGILISSRSLEVPTDSYTYYYDGTYHPLAAVDLNLNILRFFKDNPMFSAGIVFEFAHSFLLQSDPRGNEDVNIDSRDMRIKAGVDLVIAPKPDSLPLWIFIDAAWAYHDFKIGLDPVDNPFLADFGYRSVDIGFGISADIVRRWLSIRVRAGFLVPYTLGGAEEFYGEKAEKRFGFNPGIRLTGVLVAGFRWALGFDFIGYTASFKGAGSIESSGYESGKKMKDFYPTGYFMLGYQY